MKYLAILLLIPLEIAISAFVLFQLWSWFVVATFNMTPITIGQAAGLSLLVSFFLVNSNLSRDEVDGTSWDSIIMLYTKGAIRPLSFLFIGFIYLQVFTSV